MNALDQLYADLDTIRAIAARYRSSSWVARWRGRLLIDALLGEVLWLLEGWLECEGASEGLTRADGQPAETNRKAA